MFAMALETLILEAMGGHIYTFNGSIKKQNAGAAIGTTLAGALAVMYMIRWSLEFNRRLVVATSMFDFSLLMLKYYVDDGNIISITFPPFLCEDGVIRILDNIIKVDRQTPADQRTALLVCEVGNTISNFIRLTVDYPSKHSNGFMPLLDLQVAMCNNKVIY